MKRKQSNILDTEESRFSKLLFNKTSNFIKNIENISEEDNEVEDKKAAWHDEDDELFTTSCIMDSKNDDKYSNTIKQKYINLMGTPEWAKLSGRIKQDSDDEDQILRTVGHLDKRKKLNGLMKDYLELKRFPKINSQTGNEGPIIKGLEFHPTSSVALVGGQFGIISLFSIGGDNNNKLHSFQLPNFRLLSTRFTPDGSEALIASDIKHHYYVYNLVKAESTLVSYPRIIRRPTLFELSPCGKYIAVTDGFEEVHLICAKSKELLRSLRQNSVVVAVTFSPDSEKLYTFSVCGLVAIWDLSIYRVTHKFADHGCVTGSYISMSPCGGLLATGSGEGIVNVYESKSLLTTSNPIPHRTIENLRTKITDLKFNSSSEMLALSSAFYPNALKLVHIPSYHVFSNFPESNSKFHQIAAFNFSPNSGYMGFANNRHSAYLYRLKHYENY